MQPRQNGRRHPAGAGRFDRRAAVLSRQPRHPPTPGGADPDNAEWQRDLSISHDNIGGIQPAQGDLTGAPHPIAPASTSPTPGRAGPGQRRVAARPVGQPRQASARRAGAGRLTGAPAHYRASRDISQRLAAPAPPTPSGSATCRSATTRSADMAAAAGDLTGARADYQASLDIRERLAAAGPGQRRVAARPVGQPRQARRTWRAAGRPGRRPRPLPGQPRHPPSAGRADPANTEWQRDLSVCHEKLGDVAAWRPGDLAAARDPYQASLDIAHGWPQPTPPTPSGSATCRSATTSSGTSRRRQGDLTGAPRPLPASLDIANGWPRRTRPMPSGSATCRSARQDRRRRSAAQGDLAGAPHPYQASLDIRRRWPQPDPANAEWQRDLSVSHDKIGDMPVAQGDLTGALHAYRASLDIRQRLAPPDPDNAEWQRDLSVSHNKIGDVPAAQGDLAGALQSYPPASTSPTPGARRTRAMPGGSATCRSATTRSAACRGAGRSDRRAAPIAPASTSAKRWRQPDPDNAGWQRDLSVSHDKIGDMQGRRAI